MRMSFPCRRPCTGLAILLLFFAGIPALFSQDTWGTWHKGISSLAAAKQMAMASNRPLLVVAGVTNCAHCESLENKVLHTTTLLNFARDNKIVLFECRDLQKLTDRLFNNYGDACGMSKIYPFSFLFKVNEDADLTKSEWTSLDPSQVTLLTIASGAYAGRKSGFNYAGVSSINGVSIETEANWKPSTYIKVLETYFPNHIWSEIEPPVIPTHTGYETAYDFGRIPNSANPPASSNQWIVSSTPMPLTSAATQNWFKFVGDLGKRYVFSAKGITNNNPGVGIMFELFGSEQKDSQTAPLESAYKTITATGFDALDRGIQIDMPTGTDTGKTYFVRISHAASAISEITYTLKVHEARRAPAPGVVTNPDWTGARLGKWTMDRAAAETQSLVDGKPVIYLFSGLLWCPYCVGMDHQVLQTPAFTTATANAYLVVLDNQYRDDTGPSLLRDNTTGGYQKTHNILDDGAAKLTDNIAVQNALALPTATLWGPAGDNQRKKIGYPTLVYCVPAAAPARAAVNGLASVGRISGDYEAASVIAKLNDLAAMAADGFVEDNTFAFTSTQALVKDSPEPSRIGGGLIAADWWRFTVPADKAVEITATGAGAPAGTAISLAAYAADGVQHIKTATGPATAPVRLVFSPTGDTEYLLQVTSTGATASFSYTLRLVETTRTYVLSMADQERNVSKNDAEVSLRLNMVTLTGNELPITFKCRLRFPDSEDGEWQEFTITDADKATPYAFSMTLPVFAYPDGEITELVAEIIEADNGNCQVDPVQAATTVNVLGFATFNYPAETTFALYKDVAITQGALSFPIIGGGADGESVNFDPDRVPPGLLVENLTDDRDNPRVEITGTPEGEANDEYTLWLILMPSEQFITLTFVLKDLPSSSDIKAFAGYLVKNDDDTAAQAIRGDIKVDNDLDGPTGKITVRIATQDTKAATVFEFTAWSSYSPDPGTLDLVGLTSATLDGSTLRLQIGLDGTCTGTYTSPLGNSFAIHASAATEEPKEYEGYYTVALREWQDPYQVVYACHGWLRIQVDGSGLVTYQGELIDGTSFGPQETYITSQPSPANNLSGVPDGELTFFVPLEWQETRAGYPGRLAGRLTIVSQSEREKLLSNGDAPDGDAPTPNDAWVSACSGADFDNSVWEKAAGNLILLDPCGTVFDTVRSVAAQVNPDSGQPYFYISVQPAPELETEPDTRTEPTAFAPGIVLPNHVMLEEKRDAKTMEVATDGILSAELGDLTYNGDTGIFTGNINVLKTADGSASGALERTTCPIRGILTPITSDCCRLTANLAVGHGYFRDGEDTYIVTLSALAVLPATTPTLVSLGGQTGPDFYYVFHKGAVGLTIDAQTQKVLRRETSLDGTTTALFLHDWTGEEDTTKAFTLNTLRQEFTGLEDGKAESDIIAIPLQLADTVATFAVPDADGNVPAGAIAVQPGWNLLGIPWNVKVAADYVPECSMTYDAGGQAFVPATSLSTGDAVWVFLEDGQQFVLYGETTATPAQPSSAPGWTFMANPDELSAGTRWFWKDGQFTTEPPAQPQWQGVWHYYPGTNP